MNTVNIVKGEERSFILKLRTTEGDDPVDLTGASAVGVKLPRADAGKIDRSSLGKSFSYAVVDISNDVIPYANHGYVQNDKVQFTTTGTLPAGLSLLTDYYVKYSSKDAFQVSASEDGAAINITDQGSGTHTIAPLGASISGAPELGKIQVTIKENASAYLNAGTFQPFEVYWVISGVTRRLKVERVLSVVEEP